jgi:hypothetical protein
LTAALSLHHHITGSSGQVSTNAFSIYTDLTTGAVIDLQVKWKAAAGLDGFAFKVQGNKLPPADQ